MKVLLLLAIIGSALALQDPVEYQYHYRARLAAGIQSGRPQFSGTGLKATVKVTVEQEGEATIEVSEIQVGEKNQILGHNGRDELQIDYKDIKDKALEQPFKAHFRKREGETVMEVPSTDQLWVTNVRRGIVNFFRVAPIVDPSSVRPSQSSDGRVEPQVISRMEDTYAGRCRVGYTLSPATVQDIPQPLREDIQSQTARKGSAGNQIKLTDTVYSLKTAVDFDSCSGRVSLIQSGSIDLTNVTSSSFKDAASRTYVSHHILKGSAGKFRIESGTVETQYLMNPIGVESDKMVVISNQTMSLEFARPCPNRMRRSSGPTKQIKTWKHQVQSPNNKPQGYSPEWVQYKKENSQGFSPIFYEKLVTGLGLPASSEESLMTRARDAIKHAAQRLDRQNKDTTEGQEDYRGSDDGRAAQELQYAHKIIRSLSTDAIKKIDTELDSDQSSVAHELFLETLAVAASGPALDQLFDKIQSGKLSDNRTASIFFSIANNIQSPEPMEKMMKYVMSLREQDRVIVSLLSKVNFALVARRLCVTHQLRDQTHMRYAFGDKMCDRNMIISQYLPHLESRISGDGPVWVKTLNTIAVADLGASEGLNILEKVARGHVDSDKFMRYAAIHGMGRLMFDNTSQHHIFNILQPIAESQVEDYRIRQVAYNTLMTWRPNSTFIHRMAVLSNTEPSVQVQSFMHSVIQSLARTDDHTLRTQSATARNLLPTIRYVLPSSERAMSYSTSRHSFEDKIGMSGRISWLTQFKSSYPREIYTYLAAKYSDVEVPLSEMVTFSNTGPGFSRLIQAVQDFSKPHSQKIHSQKHGSEQQQPEIYYYTKLFTTSEAFLPMTSEIYNTLRNSLSRGSSSSAPERTILHKYFNPIESNVILPSPTGLFFHIEMNSPTVLYSNMEVQAFSEPKERRDANELPALDRVNIKAEGIAKAISKFTRSSIIFAPWTNKTVMVSVDSEKSISLPMKYEAQADLREPAQIFSAKITPQLTQTQVKIPVIKIRFVPYTSIGGLLSHPVDSSSITDFKQVRWLYAKDQESQVVTQISEENTGLNAEVSFRGEAVPPMNQPNIYNYLIDEPSRMLSLLTSPSIKGYDLSVYQKTGQTATKSIGFYLRYLSQPGEQSTPSITVPKSAGEPMDVRTEDSQTQREQKLKKFSPRQNYEYSAQVNFTGAQTKKYEVILASALQEGQADQQKIQHDFHKLQLSFIQKNSESQRKASTCFVTAIDRPELEPTATIDNLVQGQKQQSLQSTIAVNVYEGDSCSQSQKPLAESTAKLSVSDSRALALSDVTEKDAQLYNNTREFFRLAVYDQLHLEATWGEPSEQLKNETLRVKDLLEGYLFPNLVKNHLQPNSPKKMEVNADRSLSDDRVDAWVKLPTATIQGQRIAVSPVFDILAAFTPQVSRITPPSAAISAVSPGDKCYVLASHVRIFDGDSYEKKPTGCNSIALKSLDDKLTVLTRQTESDQQEVKISDNENQLEILVRGQFVKVNSQVMSENQKELTDRSGRVFAKLSRQQSSVKVMLVDKMELEIRDSDKMQIKLDSRYKNSVQGLCGNYNGQSSDDLKDQIGCHYPTSKGLLFGAAWITPSFQCEEQDMKPLLEETRSYQHDCPKSYIHLQNVQKTCDIQAFPISHDGRRLCVPTERVLLCDHQCRPTSEATKSLPSHCWNRNHAPSEVTDNVRIGFVSEHVTAEPDSVQDARYRVPSGCKPMATLADDSECYVHGVYPVQTTGPLLCVTKKPTVQCKDTCNIGDTSPAKMEGKCWNESNAPTEVKEGQRQGYVTSPVSASGPFTRDMIVQIPQICNKRST